MQVCLLTGKLRSTPNGTPLIRRHFPAKNQLTKANQAKTKLENLARDLTKVIRSLCFLLMYKTNFALNLNNRTVRN